MISPEELDRLLKAEESDSFERKASLSDKDSIRDTIIAFANDIANRGGGTLLLGQRPDKSLVGLMQCEDEAQRLVSEIARNRVYPAVHITIDVCKREAKTLLVVTIPSSVGRPHFRGPCYVRQGSSNRVATDAESMALRAAARDEKVRQLLTWLQQGETRITCERLPSGRWGRVTGALMEVTPTYATLDDSGGQSSARSVALSELQLGYDHSKKRPLVRYPIE